MRFPRLEPAEWAVLIALVVVVAILIYAEMNGGTR